MISSNIKVEGCSESWTLLFKLDVIFYFILTRVDKQNEVTLRYYIFIECTGYIIWQLFLPLILAGISGQ